MTITITITTTDVASCDLFNLASLGRKRPHEDKSLSRTSIEMYYISTKV